MDQEEFVLVLVPVPDERTLKLGQLHVVSVHLTLDLRLPMRREEGELLRQVDLIHASAEPSLRSRTTETRTTRAARR